MSTGSTAHPEARAASRWSASCCAGERRSSDWPTSAPRGDRTGGEPAWPSGREGSLEVRGGKIRGERLQLTNEVRKISGNGVKTNQNKVNILRLESKAWFIKCESEVQAQAVKTELKEISTATAT